MKIKKFVAVLTVAVSALFITTAVHAASKFSVTGTETVTDYDEDEGIGTNSEVTGVKFAFESDTVTQLSSLEFKIKFDPAKFNLLTQAESSYLGLGKALGNGFSLTINDKNADTTGEVLVVMTVNGEDLKINKNSTTNTYRKNIMELYFTDITGDVNKDFQYTLRYMSENAGTDVDTSSYGTFVRYSVPKSAQVVDYSSTVTGKPYIPGFGLLIDGTLYLDNGVASGLKWEEEGDNYVFTAVLRPKSNSLSNPKVQLVALVSSDENAVSSSDLAYIAVTDEVEVNVSTIYGTF